MSTEWDDLKDRAEALVEQSATDPVTIARTLHHLSMLGRELTEYIARPGDGLLAVAADLTVDADARRAYLIDSLLEKGYPITRARERATYEVREDRRRAEQAKIVPVEGYDIAVAAFAPELAHESGDPS